MLLEGCTQQGLGAGKVNGVDGVIGGIRWGLRYSYIIYYVNFIII